MTQSVYYGFAKQLFESVLLKGDLVDIAHLKSATSYKQVSSSLPSGSPKIRTISFILLITSLVFLLVKMVEATTTITANLLLLKKVLLLRYNKLEPTTESE